MYSLVPLPDLVVADTETESNVLRSNQYSDAVQICLIAPSNAQAGTLQVSHDGTTYVELQTMEEASTLGTVKDVATPAAGKARYYPPILAEYLKIVTGAVTEDATYKVYKLIETT